MHTHYILTMITTSLRIPLELKGRLDAEAERRGVRASEIMRGAINEHLEKRERRLMSALPKSSDGNGSSG